jgi:catechol 2,3-dioxygenase-like lactoylglutathione lyase family enzyme
MPIAPTRIFHVNVNCSDLERSLAFYTDLIGLTPATRTTPESPQPGGAFGLDQVQWDAWILKGDAGYGSLVLDLLEWKVPTPTGRPAGDPTATGFNRLGFTTPDLDALHARLVAAGADVWSAPTAIEFERGGGMRLFVCGDPDGTQLELVEGPDTRMSHIVVNCGDLEASRRYYTDVIGLAPHDDLRSTVQAGTVFRIDGDIQQHAVLMADPASGFVVELLGWITPGPTPAPERRANELGIFRMAWHTPDIDGDHRVLGEAGVRCYSPPAHLEMGPGIPPLRALFWGDPDGACLELIEPGPVS